ncbi:hypothetical protein ACOSQ3_020076 [Xanthoceras sorbifolium]
MALASYLVFFLVSHQLLLSSSEQDLNPRCPPFRCGGLNIGFPFSNQTHPECGLFVVDNCNERFGPKIQLVKNELSFYVKDISQDNTLWPQDNPSLDPCYNFSRKLFRNLTLPSSPFFSFDIPINKTLFRCPRTLDRVPKNYSLFCNDSTNSYISRNESNYSLIQDKHPNKSLRSPPHQCSPIQLQTTRTQRHVVFNNLYTGFFFLQVKVTKECYECHWKQGRCKSDSRGNFYCSNAKTGVNGDRKLPLKLGLAATASGIGILIIILAFCFRKKISPDISMAFWRKKTENYQNIEAFFRNYGSLAPKRYSYSDIKKMTNSFEVKLGQGGYGGVYKGKLLDGRAVAVKVLNESKGNGEEFINEVASISRTSHVNIVSLFGYCFQGRKRVLVYEFVPNGSLEKFIYQKSPNYKQLKWEKLYQIAVGIARGLEYLHRGCNTRILHFDIKPHNILLDEDFCPKISDFGLAKIFPGKESIISMTGARGTIGYIAPEVYCRQFGEVSHKSDVYSYGMMVLEIAGGRKNLDIRVGRTSEIYFPHWIHERLEVDEELGLLGIENEEDKECARKMIIVSLWCIQTNPSSRPAMNRVVEMLEGSLDSLQIPPKAILSSPPRSQTPHDSSASTLLVC